MELFEKIDIKAEWASAPNCREKLKKPNEDRLLFDEENGIIILLDGVTRVHKEYDERPYESASADVGEIFIDVVHRSILENINDPNTENVLMCAIERANSEIREYRKQKTKTDWEFYPSTLGFIGLIRGRVLYYVGVGDCLTVLIRKKNKILLGKEWSLEALDKQVVSKKDRYDIYCNHPENSLSYTVFNGDDSVMSGVNCSFIDLHRGDVMLIVSDGIADYVKYEKSEELVVQSPDEMISLSTKYDVPPYADYADDKTVIKISV